MSNLVETLAQKDRKERNRLIRSALSHHGLWPNLTEEVQRVLWEEKGHSIRIPTNAWWAMDYHLDWIGEAFTELGLGPRMRIDPSRPLKIEDMDFVIAWDRTLVLLEAKNESAWSNEQMGNKIQRLGEFGPVSRSRIDVGGEYEIFFLLTSPRRPQKLEDFAGWNTGGEDFAWFELPPVSLLKTA